MVREFFKNLFKRFSFNPFSRRNNFKLGLYGPPNGGKSTLANRVCQDWLGEEMMSSTSHIAHETREIKIKEQVVIKNKKGKELTFSLVDTPGIATRIDYEDFIKRGMKKTEAKKRSKEATKGVIDAIKWLDNMDSVVVVLDATKDPYSQVNITIIGNLQARNIPVLIAANKVDLKKADLEVIKSAFPQYEVIGISAKYGQHMEDFYENLFKIGRKNLKSLEECFNKRLLEKMVTFQFVPFQKIEGLSSAKRVNKLLNIVKNDSIVIMEGRLRKEEEADLIEITMEEITPSFKGIEISVIYPEKEKQDTLQKIKGAFANLLLGDRQGLTIIGPATVVKKIKRNPDKIELITQELSKSRYRGKKKKRK